MADAAPEDTGRSTGQRSDGTVAPQTAGAALALVAISLALCGQYLLIQGPPFDTLILAGAVAAYTIAVFAMIWLSDLGGQSDPRGPRPIGPAGTGAAERSAGPVTRLRRTIAASPVSAALILVGLLLSVVVDLVLWQRGDSGETYWDVFVLWLLAIALYLLPLVRPWRRLRRGRLGAALRAHRKVLLDAGALWLVALVLRLPRVGSVPDVLGGDEGLVGDVATAMTQKMGNMFSTIFAYGNLYHMLVAGWVAVLGPTATALRVPNALLGSLAAPMTYLAGRELFGRRVGLVAGALMAISHMHIHMSRTAHGQAIDAFMAAVVVFTFSRGLRRRDLGWMAVAGVFLGLAQYFYVALRVIDLVVAGFVVALIVFDRDLLRKSLGGIAAAFGASVIAAGPMVVWALRRPGDYLARINSVGIVQTGGLADQVAKEEVSAWQAMAEQFGHALLTPIAYRAISFYDAEVPMIDLVWSALLILGLAYAVYRIRDWRYLFMIMGVIGGLGVLGFGNLVTIAAYRITVVMPFFALLAAGALVLLVERGLRGLALPPRVPALIIGTVVALLAVYNLRYYFGEHIPACRYLGQDKGTSSVSLSMQYLARHAPDAIAINLTEPHFMMGNYPNAKYLSGRQVRGSWDQAPEPPAPTEPGATDFIYSISPDMATDELLRLVGDVRPVVFFAEPSRGGQLARIGEAVPGGERVTLSRCGEPFVEVYHLPSASGG